MPSADKADEAAGLPPGNEDNAVRRKICPEKLRRTHRRAKIAAGKEEDAGGLAVAKDDDAASGDFGRRRECLPLSADGAISCAYFAHYNV